MIRRCLAVIAVMLMLTFTPGHLVAPPAVEVPGPASVLLPAAIRTPETGTPVATPPRADVYASDPVLLGTGPGGPFRAAKPGTVAVVGVLPGATGQSVLVVLRNGTTDGIGRVTVSAIASTDTGPVGGATSALTPAWIAPGGLGFAHVELAVAEGTIDASQLPTVSLFGIIPTSEGAEPIGVRVTNPVDGSTPVVQLDRSGAVAGSPVRVVTVCFATTAATTDIRWSVDTAPAEPPEAIDTTGSTELALPVDCGPIVLVSAATA